MAPPYSNVIENGFGVVKKPECGMKRTEVTEGE